LDWSGWRPVAATNRTNGNWQGGEAQFLDTVQLPAGRFKLFTAGSALLVLSFDQAVVDFEQPCK